MSQLNLFATGIHCDHCKRDPGPDPRNGTHWDGFLDMDTGQHVCWPCQGKHYAKKWKTQYSGLYSEFPVMIPTVEQP